MIQTATVTYKSPRAVNIGDVFYKIEAVDFQHFREPCLVCNDKKELTVNGVTFKCPCCGNTKEAISVKGFVVQRYRVFRIIDEVGSSEWKPDNCHRVKFELYRKVGHGYYYAEHSRSSFDEYDLINRLNPSKGEKFLEHNVGKYIFDDYRLAIEAAKFLTDAEIQKLKEYNDVHGSNYVPVFRTEHDKKSN